MKQPRRVLLDALVRPRRRSVSLLRLLMVALRLRRANPPGALPSEATIDAPVLKTQMLIAADIVALLLPSLLLLLTRQKVLL